MGSYFGKEIHISIFGLSHAECIGVTIDGLPAGEAVDEEALRAFKLRRAPGRSAESTARREADEPHIICGLHNGRTCGAVVVSGTFRCDLSSFTTSTGSMRSTRTYCTTLLMNSV